MIDNVLMKKNMSLLIPVVLLYVGIRIAAAVFQQLQSFYNTRFDQAIIYDLNEKLLNKIMTLPKSFFDKSHTGYLISRLSSDIESVKWFFSSTIVQIFVNLIKLTGGTAFLFYLEWRIAIPVILALPLPFFITKFFARKNYVMSHHSSEVNAQMAAEFNETLSSINLIKSFSNEKKAVSGIMGKLKSRFNLAKEQQAVSSLNGMALNLFPSVVRFFVLVLGAYWVIDGKWSLGTLFAFQGYLAFVFGPVSFLSSSINQFQDTKASLERVSAIFEMLPEENTDTGKTVKKLNGKVEFRNVSFSYEKK